jgi:hypothetical protein
MMRIGGLSRADQDDGDARRGGVGKGQRGSTGIHDLEWKALWVKVTMIIARQL